MTDPADDPVLACFLQGLVDRYGSRLARAVLFGSRARGEARIDSDYDVAVFLKDMPDRWEEMKRLGDLTADVLLGTGGFIHAMPYRAETYTDPAIPVMHEIRREGIEL